MQAVSISAVFQYQKCYFDAEYAALKPVEAIKYETDAFDVFNWYSPNSRWNTHSGYWATLNVKHCKRSRTGALQNNNMKQSATEQII